MLIDGHVHLHRSHPIEAALDAAVLNFERWRTRVQPAEPLRAMLWLVETPAEAASERLRSAETGHWNLVERDEVTWDLHRDAGTRLTLIRGRQVATSDGLEVLLVGTADPVSDGRPLAETIEPHLERRVLVMLPWGFGKWTGRRGRAVAQAYESYGARGLRLADTGIRPGWLPAPRLFRRSAADGRPVLVGSDPFPFRETGDRIGSAGFVAHDVLPDSGWHHIQAAFRQPERSLERFGQPVGTLTFLRLQVQMQRRKHFRRHSP
jgi:hypothetical protein